MTRFVFKVFVILFVIEVNSLDEFLRGQSVLYGISSLTRDANRNTTCLNELHRLYEATDLKHFWALKVLDASGQPTSGFLWGNNLWLGSHFQCTDLSNLKPMEVNHNKVKRPDITPYDYPPYDMEFVMAYIKHNSTQQQHTQMPLETMIELGLCVPRSCSAQELQGLLQNYLDKRYFNVQEFYKLNMEILELKILNSGSWLSLPKTIVTLIICLITVALVALGTIYDMHVIQPRLKTNLKQNMTTECFSKNQSPISIIHKMKRNITEEQTPNNNNKKDVEKPQSSLSSIEKLLKCFSMHSNIKALIKTDSSSDSISSVHGVRLFSLLWVLCVHAVFYQIDFLENVSSGFRLSEHFMVQILSNSTYCVDSFLFLSGFLLSYTFYKSKQGIVKCKRPINVMAKVSEFFAMFVHRYLRLTPVYLMTMLISDLLFTYYRQSSAFKVTEQPDVNCPKYWWRNLLYVNNFYPRSEMCLSWSWYLSADTQFFALTSILLILSTISMKIAGTILFTCLVLCMAITGYRSYIIEYIPTMDEQFVQLDAIYDLPWNRIGPYLIGVITGYLLTVKLEGKLKLKKPYLFIMWIVFPFINFWIVFTIYGRQISVEFSAIYMGLSRTLWGLGLGWLFIACCTNNAGLLNKFLSFRGWIPLSRLTYCSYLLNPLLISIIYMGTESNQNASYASFTLAIFGTALLTFFTAFWYSLCFESPYILLTKMLFGNFTRRKRPNSNPA